MAIDQRLREFGSLLIDQDRARVIVPPMKALAGHWFGGGNLSEDADGHLWLVGRFRNQGDSRTGLSAGQRGLQLAIYRSSDRGKSFQKVVSFAKSDLNVGRCEVLSIEGSALKFSSRGVQLFVSTEKTGIDYPAGLESYLKPGTGVWTIDLLTADSIESLSDSRPRTILSCSDSRFVHIKDPFLASLGSNDHLLFCSHPFCWSSSNTGYVTLHPDGTPKGDPQFDFFPRGFTWDVAMTRATSVLPLSRELTGQDLNLMFYDGGECVRDLDEHSAAVKRPRGYSCEELGGLAYCEGNQFQSPRRVSIDAPLFVSPRGTGCSRYVDVLRTSDGYYATWQQSQDDHSQPLVMNFVSHEQANAVLSR